MTYQNKLQQYVIYNKKMGKHLSHTKKSQSHSWSFDIIKVAPIVSPGLLVQLFCTRNFT